MNKKPVLLISFYSPKAIGIRYLEKSLKMAGYPVYIVFLKAYNSKSPGNVTEHELELLKDVINQVKPGIIGLSVMSTLYLETVYLVNRYIKKHFDIPLLWGGIYPTLFPEKSLEHADFVIRGEGEKAIVELVDALLCNAGYGNVKNLAYRKAAKQHYGDALSRNTAWNNGSVVVNDMRPLSQDLDEYGFPEIGGDNKFFINNNMLRTEDPQLNSMSYELSASRGCPFSCTYCSTPNLRRLYTGKGKYVRFRKVESVISELRFAREKIGRLRIIRFWDEIFSDNEDWIDEFTRRYREEINLPFEIWVHPVKVNGGIIKKLVDAGLYKAVMGIQSGSCRIREGIFGRHETEEEIINASKILSDCKVPRVVYDFILRHPFEMEEDIIQTFELCMKLYHPFELQLHALNFLPGTGIVKKAIELDVMDKNKLEKIMYAPVKEQYKAYWGANTEDIIVNFWYSLVYMAQFRTIKPVAGFLAKNVRMLEKKFSFTMGLPIKFQKYLATVARLKDYYRKIRLILQG